MAQLTVNTCCLDYTLRTGAFIIFWLYLLYGSLFFFTLFGMLSDLKNSGIFIFVVFWEPILSSIALYGFYNDKYIYYYPWIILNYLLMIFAIVIPIIPFAWEPIVEVIFPSMHIWQEGFTAVFTCAILEMLLIALFSIHYYATTVVYSYYDSCKVTKQDLYQQDYPKCIEIKHHIQDELKPPVGIVAYNIDEGKIVTI